MEKVDKGVFQEIPVLVPVVPEPKPFAPAPEARAPKPEPQAQRDPLPGAKGLGKLPAALEVSATGGPTLYDLATSALLDDEYWKGQGPVAAADRLIAEYDLNALAFFRDPRQPASPAILYALFTPVSRPYRFFVQGSLAGDADAQARFRQRFLQAAAAAGIDGVSLTLIGPEERDMTEALEQIRAAGSLAVVIAGNEHRDRLRPLFDLNEDQRPTVALLASPVDPGALISLILNHLDRFGGHLTTFTDLNAGLEGGTVAAFAIKEAA